MTQKSKEAPRAEEANEDMAELIAKAKNCRQDRSMNFMLWRHVCTCFAAENTTVNIQKDMLKVLEMKTAAILYYAIVPAISSSVDKRTPKY